MKPYRLRDFSKQTGESKTSLMWRDIYELPPLPDQHTQYEIALRALSDPLAARECMRIVALYIRHTTGVFDRVLDHHAIALEAALSVPGSESAKILTDALGITAPRKRQSAHYLLVGPFVEHLMIGGSSKTAALELAAKNFDMSTRSAGRKYLEYLNRPYSPDDEEDAGNS